MKAIMKTGLEIIPLAAVVIMLLTILLQIIARFFYPLAWTGEFARVCNVWVVFLGAYLVCRRDEHIKVEYFANLLPAKIQPWLDLFINLLCMFSLLVVIFSGSRAFIGLFYIKTPAAQIPVPCLFAGLMIGSLLMLIDLAYRTFNNIYRTSTRTKVENRIP